ncbi:MULTISPECIES: hypothetical protein [Bacillus cereus group]|nr:MULTISPECIES: hypothetical protein [Bacillus cereus group]
MQFIYQLFGIEVTFAPEPHKKYRHPSHEEYRYFSFIPLFVGSKRPIGAD